MTKEYSKNSEQEAPKTVFESLLEKTVKGAENLPDSISLTAETPAVNPFNWKFDNVRYNWKANFPYSPPKEDNKSADVSLRYIILLKLKNYSKI